MTLYDGLILLGRFNALCLPSILYHGTSRNCMQAIQHEGLRPDIPDKQSRLSSDAVYLITDLTIAAHMARTRALRQEDEPVVLSIHSSRLDPDLIAFDLNMSGRHWTESITYSSSIPADAITELPGAAAHKDANNMLLGEPRPGQKPVVFNLSWTRAADFLAHVLIQPGKPNIEEDDYLVLYKPN